MQKKDEIVPGRFWKTQPVPQSREEPEKTSDVGHAIDPIKEPKDVRQTPLKLPANFEWFNPNVDDAAELTSVYELLRDHYVEDDDNMFRFDYSREFLKWALKPPGFIPDWHLAVRMTSTKQLVGFITGIPVTVFVHGKEHRLCEINFLCVHSTMRSKRLAPILIREITRRVNVTGVFQAVYTAGVVIPTPIASCQYWHRSLNPKKLIDVRFSYLKRGQTMARTVKDLKLPLETTLPLRPITDKDIPSAQKLVMNYLTKFKLYMAFDEEEFKHWFMPLDNVISTFVVEKDGEITDLCSYYSLPSTIINHPRHKMLNAAYSWYNVATSTDITSLMRDSLTLASKNGYDVFNCLQIHDNTTFLEELKFGAGDGFLQYYLYNWVCPTLEPHEMGMVLL